MNLFSLEFLPVMVFSIAGGIFAFKVRSKILMFPLIFCSVSLFIVGFLAEYRCDRSIANLAAQFFRGDQVCPEIAEDRGNTDEKPPLVNFVSAIEPFPVPSRVDWNIRGWDGLQSLMPWLRSVLDEGGKPFHIFQSCEHFDRRGAARFQFGGFSPMNFAGDEVIEWTVSACGPRAGLSSLSFSSDHTKGLKNVFSGLRGDLETQGYEIEYLGCEGLYSEPTSFYRISRADIEPFIIKIYYFENASSAVTEITAYYQSVDVSDCERNLNILEIAYP